MSKNKRCWTQNCNEPGIRCVFIWHEESDLPYWRYCPEHAKENGFCYGCGVFQAGLDRFDFGPYRGLCDNCADEVRASEAWENEDDYYSWEVDSYAAEYGSGL